MAINYVSTTTKPLSACSQYRYKERQHAGYLSETYCTVQQNAVCTDGASFSRILEAKAVAIKPTQGVSTGPEVVTSHFDNSAAAGTHDRTARRGGNINAVDIVVIVMAMVMVTVVMAILKYKS